MFRKICSSLYLLSGILIALGGLGHSFGAVAQIHTALGGSAVDPRVFRLIIAVWHFAGAAMVALGALVVAGWMKARSGQKTDKTVPVVVALFYVAYGICALLWMREPFWTIFVVYGALAGGGRLGDGTEGLSRFELAALGIGLDSETGGLRQWPTAQNLPNGSATGSRS